ncbi:hypothetical protein ES708_24432 [subsurface metagenome]
MGLAVLKCLFYRAAIADLFVTGVDPIAFLSQAVTKKSPCQLILIDNVIVFIHYIETVFQGAYYRLQLVLLGLKRFIRLLMLGDIPGYLKTGDHLSLGVFNGTSCNLHEGLLPRR